MKSVVIITGRCAREAEVRHIGAKNTAVADMCIACDSGFGDSKKSAFVDLTLWGRQAEIAGEYVRKGNVFEVVGELTQDEWEDKQSGQKRSKLKVTVNELILFPKSMNGNPQESVARSQSQEAVAAAASDLPF